jgi:hypothetical protein
MYIHSGMHSYYRLPCSPLTFATTYVFVKMLILKIVEFKILLLCKFCSSRRYVYFRSDMVSSSWSLCTDAGCVVLKDEVMHNSELCEFCRLLSVPRVGEAKQVL